MTKEYVEIIHDEEELKWFFENVMPDLAATECYFLSLSARNKYLTKEEREFYDLGRTEMFEKKIIRKKEWSRFLRTIRKMECDSRGYTTKNGMPIPSKTMVCYLNINPSDTVKALSKFQAIINEYFIEIASIAFNRRDTDNIANRINKIDNNLMTCYQQATGNKTWLDFDFDIPKNSANSHVFVSLYSMYLNSEGFSNYFWIDTKSGYHLLLRKEQMRQSSNPKELVEQARKMVLKRFSADELGEDWEVIYNKNAMIPLPGTYQGGHKVVVINKNIIGD